MSPFGYNVSNMKLDMLTEVGISFKEKQELAEAAKAAAEAEAEAIAAEEEELRRLRLEKGEMEEEEEEEHGAVGELRNYDQLMDTFSLHHFIIRHGHTLSSTPEFLSFQRK